MIKNLSQNKAHDSWFMLAHCAMISFRCFSSTDKRKLKVSAFNGGLFTAGSRGSAYAEAEQSLAYGRTQCIGCKLLTNHFSLCVCICIFKYCNFVAQSLPGGNPQGTYEEANKEENKEKNRYPNILPCECALCSVRAQSSCESHLRAHSFLFLCHMPF